MVNHKCLMCGGNLVLTIGSDTAFCDHCGQAEPVDPQDVKKYQDIYQSAETLMHTDSLSGYTDALTRLQSISFIPQAKEKAAFCEKRIKQLQTLHDEKTRRKEIDEGKDTRLGIVITIMIVLFLAALVVSVVYVAFQLYKGNLSQTEIIVIASVAVVFVLLLIICKIRS